jgi:hypothetical protein
MHRILEILKIMICTGLEHIFGMTKGNMKVIGTRIKCMEKAPSVGKMARSTKEIMLMTKKKERAYSSGRMEECMMACGKLGDNTERVIIFHQRELRKRVFGMVELMCNGFKRRGRRLKLNEPEMDRIKIMKGTEVYLFILMLINYVASLIGNILSS